MRRIFGLGVALLLGGVLLACSTGDAEEPDRSVSNEQIIEVLQILDSRITDLEERIDDHDHRLSDTEEAVPPLKHCISLLRSAAENLNAGLEDLGGDGALRPVQYRNPIVYLRDCVLP